MVLPLLCFPTSFPGSLHPTPTASPRSSPRADATEGQLRQALRDDRRELSRPIQHLRHLWLHRWKVLENPYGSWRLIKVPLVLISDCRFSHYEPGIRCAPGYKIDTNRWMVRCHESWAHEPLQILSTGHQSWAHEHAPLGSEIIASTVAWCVFKRDRQIWWHALMTWSHANSKGTPELGKMHRFRFDRIYTCPFPHFHVLFPVDAGSLFLI